MLTDGETIYRIPGVEDAGLDDIEVGDRAGALVTRTEEGSLLAKVLVVRKGENSLLNRIMAPVEASTALVGRALEFVGTN